MTDLILANNGKANIQVIIFECETKIAFCSVDTIFLVNIKKFVYQ